jgi:hypothetical protein
MTNSALPRKYEATVKAILKELPHPHTPGWVCMSVHLSWTNLNISIAFWTKAPIVVRATRILLSSLDNWGMVLPNTIHVCSWPNSKFECFDVVSKYWEQVWEGNVVCDDALHCAALHYTTQRTLTLVCLG